MSRVVLIDAGIFIALASRRDQHHVWAVEALERMEDARFVTCEAVLSEALFLLRSRRLGAEAFDRLVDVLAPEVVPVWGPRVRELVRTYAERMDLADACLVALAEAATGAATVFTVDREDFSIYRMQDGRPVPTLMPPWN